MEEEDEEGDDLLDLWFLSWLSKKEKSSFNRTRLNKQQRRNRKGVIRRAALHSPNKAPFWKLFNSQQDDALVTLCGFNHKYFTELHDLFQPMFDTYTPYGDGFHIVPKVRKKGGQKRSVTSISCLALILAWTRTRGSNMVLQIIFGLTATPLNMWLRFGRRILVKALCRNEKAAVTLPSDEELQEFVDIISEKYPLLTNVWGAMDGLKLRLQSPGGEIEQSLYYNGWTHDHYATNLFLFSPDGRIRAMYINAPGCLHDSTLAVWSGIYTKIERLHQEKGVSVVVDSAFNKEKISGLIKSNQDNVGRDGNPRQPFNVNRQATSVRQLSEWGMRGLQASFPRLKDRLLYDEVGERKIILELIVLLFNFLAVTVGQNQITSVFMPWLERNANEYSGRI